MTLHHPSRADLDLADVLQALSDATRLQIVRRLDDTEGGCTCGAFGLALTKSTLTHHFRVLREAGIIHQRCEGTAKVNTLRRADLDTRFPGLLDAVVGSVPAPVG
jgi:DNA-binding transcriptional ArsR family regulator